MKIPCKIIHCILAAMLVLIPRSNSVTCYTVKQLQHFYGSDTDLQKVLENCIILLLTNPVFFGAERSRVQTVLKIIIKLWRAASQFLRGIDKKTWSTETITAENSGGPPALQTLVWHLLCGLPKTAHHGARLWNRLRRRQAQDDEDNERSGNERGSAANCKSQRKVEV